MPEIIKTYRQALPALRFIGKQYGDADRVDGTFSSKWDEWFQRGWFTLLEQAAGASLENICEDGGAYLGLMRSKESEAFQYWIGMLTPAGTAVPDGFFALDFPALELAVAWVQSKENTGEIYCQEEKCLQALAQAGIGVRPARDGAWWCAERYVCPRFTTPDAQGNIILDICFLQGL